MSSAGKPPNKRRLFAKRPAGAKPPSNSDLKDFCARLIKEERGDYHAALIALDRLLGQKDVDAHTIAGKYTAEEIDRMMQQCAAEWHS